MPRKPKPRALKLLQGTVRKSRDREEPKFPPASKDVTPPDWLTNSDALKLWGELTEMLTALFVLTTADLVALAHLCNLHGELVKLIRVGHEPTAAQFAQLRYMLAEFGLTPASRGKVKPAGTSEPTNPFAALGAGS